IVPPLSPDASNVPLGSNARSLTRPPPDRSSRRFDASLPVVLQSTTAPFQYPAATRRPPGLIAADHESASRNGGGGPARGSACPFELQRRTDRSSRTAAAIVPSRLIETS